MEGRVLRNRYRLVSKLGRGGMGAVWRAQDLNLGIDVAVKLIDPSFADSPDALARFRREALAGAGLRCTHIVHVTDYGVDDDIPFIAMDLLEGESLAARLLRVRKLPFRDTLRLLEQVQEALTFAHNRRIVHRDLKPENIFITREGTKEVVKVLDFGVAKVLDSHSFDEALKTHTGAMLGSPFYMSPEQTRGSASLDHRTDIWSFGVITYECVTGKRPFASNTLPDLLMAICRDPVIPPSQLTLVPDGFDEWFSHATARDVDARFSSIEEAMSELEALVRPRSVEPVRAESTPVHVVESKPPTPNVARLAEAASQLSESVVPSSVTQREGRQTQTRRIPLRAGVGAAVSACGLLLMGGLVWLATKPESQPQPVISPSVAVLAALPVAVPSVVEKDKTTTPVPELDRAAPSIQMTTNTELATGAPVASVSPLPVASVNPRLNAPSSYDVTTTPRVHPIASTDASMKVTRVGVGTSAGGAAAVTTPLPKNAPQKRTTPRTDLTAPTKLPSAANSSKKFPGGF